MPAGSFSSDLAAIRELARQKVAEGAVTKSHRKDSQDVIAVLNEVVATGSERNRAMLAAERISLAEEAEHAGDLVDLLGG
jgi:hypothetical protein